MTESIKPPFKKRQLVLRSKLPKTLGIHVSQSL